MIPWFTTTDSFDSDFGVAEYHGHNVFIRDGERVFRTYFTNWRGDEAMGTVWSYLDITPLGRQETWEDSPEGYPQTPPYKWWNWHDNYAEATPDPKWVEVSMPERLAFREMRQLIALGEPVRAGTRDLKQLLGTECDSSPAPLCWRPAAANDHPKQDRHNESFDVRLFKRTELEDFEAKSDRGYEHAKKCTRQQPGQIGCKRSRTPYWRGEPTIA